MKETRIALNILVTITQRQISMGMSLKLKYQIKVNSEDIVFENINRIKLAKGAVFHGLSKLVNYFVSWLVRYLVLSLIH